jgi:hypothetical protein
MARRLVPPVARICSMLGSVFSAYRSEMALVAAAATPWTSSRFGLPSVTPRSLAALSGGAVLGRRQYLLQLADGTTCGAGGAIR